MLTDKNGEISVLMRMLQEKHIYTPTKGQIQRNLYINHKNLRDLILRNQIKGTTK